MLIEPQKLEYTDSTNLGQCITLPFIEQKTPIYLPIEKAIEVAVAALRSPTPVDIHYRKQAWDLLKMFILSSVDLEMNSVIGNRVVLHSSMHDEIPDSGPIQRQTDDKCRGILTNALGGLFIATGVKEIRKDVYTLLVPLIRHLAMVMTAQQTGPFVAKVCNMDPYVLFDAMASVLANEEKAFNKPVLFGLSVLMNCVINMLRSKERVSIVFLLTVRFLGLLRV